MLKTVLKTWLPALIAGGLLLVSEVFMLYRLDGRTLFRSDLILVIVFDLVVIVLCCLILKKFHHNLLRIFLFGITIPLFISAALWTKVAAEERFICLDTSDSFHGSYAITKYLQPYIYQVDYWLVEDKCKTERKTKKWNAPFISF